MAVVFGDYLWGFVLVLFLFVGWLSSFGVVFFGFFCCFGIERVLVLGVICFWSVCGGSVLGVWGLVLVYFFPWSV